MNRVAASITLAALFLGSASAHAQAQPSDEAVASGSTAVEPSEAPMVEEGPLGPEPPPQEMGPFPADASPEITGTGSVEAAPTVVDPTFERLFGEPEAPAEPPPGTTPPTFAAPEMPVWLWGILFLMLVALFFSRRSLFPRRGDDAGIDVRSRTSLGKDGHLAVVEVGDGDGGRRRLLVGFGTGAPRLVADLTPMPDLPGYPDLEDAERERIEPPAAPRMAPPAPDEAPAPRSRWEDALDAPEGPTEQHRPTRRPRPVALERRGDLIAEVLAERTRRSVEVGGPMPDHDEDEGEGAAGQPGSTYTFRGTQG